MKNKINFKWKEIDRKPLVRVCNQLSLLLHAMACLGGYFIIEWMCRHSFMEAWNYLFDRSWVFLYNSFLIFLTTLPVYFLRRRIFYRTTIAVLWFVLGLINSVLLLKRVTPFTGPDLLLFTEGLGVLEKYMSGGQLVGILILLALLVAGIVFLFFKAPKYQGRVAYIRGLVMVVVFGVGFGVATKVELDKRLLSTYFGNVAFAYEDYGYPYCLAVTLLDTGVSQPNGYSDNLVHKIMQNQGEDEASKDIQELPNVIFIQLETFFDPTEVRFLQFSEDPIPYYRSLMKNYSSGFYTVPSVGAGTANTEFETLTGMSMRYFGAGEYPYKGILKEQASESAAFIWDSLGYTSHAIHNNEANFYSRRAVFGNIGFDTFTSSEYMDTQDDKNELGWMRDENLIKYITGAMDSTITKDFVFTVSVQGHGAYPEEPVLEDPAITVSGAATDGENCQWEYYVNQLHEMDQFLEKLIATLESQDEDVVLFLYGDHLPTLNLEEEDLKKGNLFQTKYVMWDNMGLERKTKSLNAYQAMAEVMDRVGVHEGIMFQFHQKMQKDPYYQIDMQTLMYDMLYGEKYVYGEENPYRAKSLHMGIKDAYLAELQHISDTMFYAKGSNFTQSSKIEVNGEMVDTTYISNDTLLVKNVELQDRDQVGVVQQSNSSTAKVLTRGNVIIYFDPVIQAEKEAERARAKREAERKKRKEEERRKRESERESGVTEGQSQSENQSESQDETESIEGNR